MKLLLTIALAVLVASQLVSASCHNATGSCTKTHFVCANEESVAHHKRCNGVEDCADGTDEYLCDQAPTPLMSLAPAERNAIMEVSCIKCTCKKGTLTINQVPAAWWQIALKAPRDFTMMTDDNTHSNTPCNTAKSAQILLNVYKKQNKGCRGWVCCFRQQQCSSCTGGGTIAFHCN